MKLNDELKALLNAQVNMEIEAAYQYKAMSAYFEGRELEGFAKWMLKYKKNWDILKNSMIIF